MIEVSPIGTLEVSCGRADATARMARLANKEAIGRCRRQREARGSTARSSAMLEYVIVCRRRRRIARR